MKALTQGCGTAAGARKVTFGLEATSMRYRTVSCTIRICQLKSPLAVVHKLTHDHFICHS